MSLLEVENLTISFPQPLSDQWKLVVDNVSFTLGNEKIGLVIAGESGSGKSMIGRAIMGLLPPSARLPATKFTFMGKNLLTLSAKEWQYLRGKEIALILQDPHYSLNPNFTIGRQIAEMFHYHKSLSKKQAHYMALESLAKVNIQEPERVMDLYPLEISGGMGQRVMIAMMLAAHPKLLIADEPTSALDQDNKEQFLQLVTSLVKSENMSLLLISHDLDLVQNYCDKALIMSQGKAVAVCPAKEIKKEKNPYVQGLLSCVPRLDKKQRRLPTIPPEVR